MKTLVFAAGLALLSTGAVHAQTAATGSAADYPIIRVETEKWARVVKEAGIPKQ